MRNTTETLVRRAVLGAVVNLPLVEARKAAALERRALDIAKAAGKTGAWAQALAKFAAQAVVSFVDVTPADLLDGVAANARGGLGEPHEEIKIVVEAELASIERWNRAQDRLTRALSA